ncbi:glutaminyl-peptide cyclotransferase [Solwaraspora sp. WMMD1047]|uniref:glutaminyl-peptide cyclotransferase n=1 Tax=Solwaraspora sp. WMMD1047 TaxID=3016102 RepID=UPI0024166624|nr:glutaminyl-peptide cyclotransferase [Solwaraspora sp. WMMD1047]MDG4833814.1 glutaminyl-peptide cyclotransferase [Solwaraspora sp. WMMD1047]
MEVAPVSWRWAALAAFTFVVLPGPTMVAQPTEQTAPRLRVEVLGTVPHDTSAFTQGLELHDGILYEGTGLEGRSQIRALDPDTGQVQQQVALPAEVFGEGITVVDDTIWQLTWQDGIAYQRDRATLAERRQVTYPGEGWGICHDADRDRLVMSDGTDRLTFRDPDTFEPAATVAVTLDGQPLRSLNELECVGEKVWANVWQTDQIVRIDPATGTVDAVVDAAGLLTPDERAGADVLNGITAVPCTDNFLITGKLWPKMFRVRFVPAG